MKARCYNPNRKRYVDYGGRGITVCDEWKNDVKAFYDWAMANGYSDDLTIDRIDTNGNYCPENCRWVGQDVQGNNKTDNILVERNGETHTIGEWANITGIRYATLYNRIVKLHWTAEKALNKK